MSSLFLCVIKAANVHYTHTGNASAASLKNTILQYAYGPYRLPEHFALRRRTEVCFLIVFIQEHETIRIDRADFNSFQDSRSS